MFRFTKSVNRLFYLHFEWLALATGLLLMALLTPGNSGTSLCPLDYIGFTFCPGEGLGNSIAYFFRGEVINSFYAHPVGIPAIFIITGRIFHILNRNRMQLKRGTNAQSI